MEYTFEVSDQNFTEAKAVLYLCSFMQFSVQKNWLSLRVSKNEEKCNGIDVFNVVLKKYVKLFLKPCIQDKRFAFPD